MARTRKNKDADNWYTKHQLKDELNEDDQFDFSSHLFQDNFEAFSFNSLLEARGGQGGKKDGGGGGKPDGDKKGKKSDSEESYISGDAEVDDSLEFNIKIDFKGGWTDSLKEDFITAADTLSNIITDDIPDIDNFFGDFVDDIVIEASLVNIDGPGGVLGQAGPTYIRSDGYLPVAAVMQFDVADATKLDDEGLWDDVVLHEMIHSLGFGVLWDMMGLVDSYVSTDGSFGYRFNGEAANQALAEVYPELADGFGVMIESDGGAGTAGGHWDEATFGNELMTGYIDDGVNVLSDVTIASLEDMGYQTTWGDGLIV